MVDSLLELIFRGVPESFLFVLAVHLFSEVKIDKNKYLLSSIIMSAIAYIMRLLPINYGVNTIIGLFVLIILTNNINGIDIIKSIRASIIIMILLFVCEGANVIFIQHVLGKDLSTIFSSPRVKTLYGIPSLMIFGSIILLYYLYLRHRRR